MTTAVGGPPVSGSGQQLGSRLAKAAGLAVLAAAVGGLAFAVGRESGAAALAGRSAVARVERCRGIRTRSCDAVILSPSRSVVDGDATFSGFSHVRSNSVVHVRYRAGRAVADTLPERVAEMAMLLFLGAGAAAILAGAGIVLTGRGERVALVLAGFSVFAIPVFALALVSTLLVHAPSAGAAARPATTGGGKAPAAAPSSGGRLPGKDIYAAVAAEPDRALVAQGVRFDLVDNVPMSPQGCFAAPGCLGGALAHWTVTGTDLVATSYLLVFDGPGTAAAARQTIQQQHALPNAPAPPAAAVVVGVGSGRYTSAIWINRADGSSARDNPQMVPALRGLGYFNVDPGIAEGIRSKGRP